jgi:hypothetical protein
MSGVQEAARHATTHRSHPDDGNRGHVAIMAQADAPIVERIEMSRCGT